MRADHVGTPVTKPQWDFIHDTGIALRASLDNVTAVFAPSCIGHAVLTRNDWLNIKIDDFSLAEAIRCWEHSTGRGNKDLTRRQASNIDQHPQQQDKTNNAAPTKKRHQERERRRRQNERRRRKQQRQQERRERQQERHRLLREQQKRNVRNNQRRSQNNNNNGSQKRHNSQKNGMSALNAAERNSAVGARSERSSSKGGSGQQHEQQQKPNASNGKKRKNSPNSDRQRNQKRLQRQHRQQEMREQRELQQQIAIPEPSRCNIRLLERCSWPQCNQSCPNLTNPLTGKEMRFLELLSSFGLDIEAVATALGVNMTTLNNMDRAELLSMLTQTS